jgi:hypothetical protein
MDPSLFATAYGLSTSIGLRPFLTLALASLAMHFGYLHPAPAFAFLGTDGATLLLGALALVEFGADKIPVLDHTLHVLHFAVKPVAAAVLVGATVGGTGSPDALDYASMGLGAMNALGVHSGIAALRGASTVTTAGIANPFISLIEDVLAVVAALCAILLPIVGAAVAIAATLAVVWLARRVFVAARRSRTAAGTAVVVRS